MHCSPKKMDKIAIFGPPRSGTSWLGHIFNSHPDVVFRFQPLFSYGHKGALSSVSSGREVLQFFDDILYSEDAYACMQTESQKHYPRFPKDNHPTHIAFKETRYLNIVDNILAVAQDVRVIGILRNPLATLASWVRAPKEFSPTWNLEEEWRAAPRKNQGRPEEYFGFLQWKSAASDFVRFEQDLPQRLWLIAQIDPATLVA